LPVSKYTIGSKCIDLVGLPESSIERFVGFYFRLNSPSCILWSWSRNINHQDSVAKQNKIFFQTRVQVPSWSCQLCFYLLETKKIFISLLGIDIQSGSKNCGKRFGVVKFFTAFSDWEHYQKRIGWIHSYLQRKHQRYCEHGCLCSNDGKSVRYNSKVLPFFN